MKLQFSAPAHAIMTITIDGVQRMELEPHEVTEIEVKRAGTVCFDFTSVHEEDVDSERVVIPFEPKRRLGGLPPVAVDVFKNGRKMFSFSSQSEAARQMGLQRPAIRFAMISGRPYSGFVFKKAHVESKASVLAAIRAELA